MRYARLKSMGPILPIRTFEGLQQDITNFIFVENTNVYFAASQEIRDEQ